MVYDKRWSKKFIEDHGNDFSFEPFHYPLKLGYKGTKTNSYLGFINNICVEVIGGVEREYRYEGIVLHNSSPLLLEVLSMELVKKLRESSLDLPVFNFEIPPERFKPYNFRGDKEGYHFIDIDYFVERGWLGDLEERLNILRQSA